MAEVKKRLGSLSHKPDCQCKFCQMRRAKEADQPATGFIPMVDDNPPAEAEKVEAKTDLLAPFNEVPIEIEHIFEAKTEAPEAEKPKDKPKQTAEEKVDWLKQWWKLVVGVAVIVIGAGLLVIGNMIKNPALIVVGAITAVGGGFLGMQSFSAGGGVKVKGAVKVKTANCLVVSARKIEFVELPEDQLLGLPMKCLNDGKYYNVHFKGLDGNGSISAISLPDPDPLQRYYDPTEALNCLRMPLTKKRLNYLPSSGQVINIIVLAAVILIETVGLIALGG